MSTRGCVIALLLAAPVIGVAQQQPGQVCARLAGCATSNVKTEKQGNCLLIKRKGYAEGLRIEEARVKGFNAGPPALENVMSIALEPTDQDRQMGIAVILLTVDGSDPISSCNRIAGERSSCHFVDAALAAAGFSVRTIGESSAEPQAVLARGKSYWASVSACK